MIAARENPTCYLFFHEIWCIIYYVYCKGRACFIWDTALLLTIFIFLAVYSSVRREMMEFCDFDIWTTLGVGMHLLRMHITKLPSAMFPVRHVWVDVHSWTCFQISGLVEDKSQLILVPWRLLAHRTSDDDLGCIISTITSETQCI